MHLIGGLTRFHKADNDDAVNWLKTTASKELAK